MNRRHFLTVSGVWLAGCASGGSLRAMPFTSNRISVVAQGLGPDVVLVPGLGSSRRVWADMVRRVPGYRYHLVQLNGFAGDPALGNSSGPVIASAVEEIARYIRERGLARPALIGHSMGGSIVLALAARHDVAGKIMVVDMLPFLGVLFGPEGTTADSVRPVAESLTAASLAADAESRQQTLTANIATMVGEGPLRQQALADALASDRHVTASAFHELITTDLRPELGRITVPVSVLYVPSAGVPITPEQFDSLYRTTYSELESVSLERISDSLHFIMHDQPGVFSARVRVFLNRKD